VPVIISRKRKGYSWLRTQDTLKEAVLKAWDGEKWHYSNEDKYSEGDDKSLYQINNNFGIRLKRYFNFVREHGEVEWDYTEFLIKKYKDV